MNLEELKKLREEFENLKSTPSILDIDESTLNEFRIKGDGNVFKRFYDAIRRDQITPTNEKIKEKENKEINNKEKQNKEIEKEIKNNEKSNIKINNKEKQNKEINNKEINNKEINNKEINNKEVNNIVKDKNKIDLKSIEKYSSSPKDVTMKDFESPPPKPKEVKPVISPATFKTNQRQSRELVSTGKLKDTDLNKYSRSGPNIKKGEKLGVISANMRKKYDLKASSFKEEAYDIVLDYVLSEGHADTVEEAHYVMMQMDEDIIRTIIKEAPFGVNKSTFDALNDPSFTGDPTSHFQNFKFKDEKNQKKYGDATKKLKIKVAPIINKMPDPKITTK